MALKTGWDLAVVGGGPAGSAAAYTAARRGLRVMLLERSGFPRDKVCGEFFSAEAAPLLRGMAPELEAEAPRIATAEFISSRGRRAEFTLPAPALGISRLRLDAALWRAAGEAGVELRPRAAVARLQAAAGGYELALAPGEVLAARAVIVAAGRWWRLAGLETAPPRSSPWVGVKARFRGLAPKAAVEMYAFRGGYCGLAPVENGWTNACCLLHRRRAGDLAASRDFSAWIVAASASPALAARLKGAVQVTATVTTAPVGMGIRAAVLGGVLLAGDASGFLDPFTGDGMARALLSGQLAGEAVAAGVPDNYPARLQRAARRGFLASGALRGLVAAPAWLQGAAIAVLARPPLGPGLAALTRWSAPRP